MVKMIILGICIGLVGALCDAFQNFMIKILRNKSTETVLLFYKTLISFIVFLPVMFYYGLKIQSHVLWIIVFFFVLIDVFSTFLYYRAVFISGLSHTMPLLSFTPVFVSILGIFILNESLNIYSVLSILMIVSGAYVLNISRFKQGIFEPFAYIFRKKGVMYMFFVAILMSFLTVLYKIGIGYSDELSFLFLLLPFESGIFLSYSLTKKSKKEIIDAGKNNLGSLIIIDLLGLISPIALAFSLNYLVSGLAIAVKRISILFSVVFGCVIFKEKNIYEAVAGSVIMFFGLVIISLFG
ncbi:EamA family transporter [Candidatus Woesearchaeota archaeon]|nr:EamA family transporter [Candidatus Woesearchaeota archaeon]